MSAASAGSVRVVRRVAWLAAVTWLLIGCSSESGDADQATSSTSGPTEQPTLSATAEDLTERLGCEDVRLSPDMEFSRYEFDESVDCLLEGQWQTRVHTFSNRDAIVGRLAIRYPDSPSVTDCQGRSADYFVVVGDRWAVITLDPETGGRAQAFEGAEALTEGHGPPVSYVLPECEN